MTDAEKLEIAVDLLDKHGLEEYEEQVYGLEEEKWENQNQTNATSRPAVNVAG